MKSKLIKILGSVLVIFTLGIIVTTNSTDPNVPPSYGQALPINSHSVDNV